MKPGARKTAIVGVHGGALKVSVSAAPERGKANAAVVPLLAKALDLPASEIEIVAGETSRDKVVEIALDPDALRGRLSFLPRAGGKANRSTV